MSLGKAETVAKCIWQKRQSVSSSRWISFTYSLGKEPIENVWKEEAHSKKKITDLQGDTDEQSFYQDQHLIFFFYCWVSQLAEA